MNILAQKITLFSLLCPLLAVVGIGYAIYYHRSDVTGMGTGYMLGAVLIVMVLFALDRLAVRYVAPGWLSAGEGLLFIASVIVFLYNTRTTTLDLSANRAPYFVLIWVKNPTRATLWQRSSLFSKTLTVPTDRVVQLDWAEFDRLTVKPPATWGNSYFSRGITLTDPRFVSAYFYGPPEHSFTENQLIGLTQQAVDRQPE